MNAKPGNKEEVRAVVMELGYELAAQRLNIKAGTLRQWARRFHWNKVRTHAQQTVTTVTKPVQVLADELAENERETRLSLARSAARMAKKSETAKLRDSQHVKNVAQTAAIVHKWDQKTQQSNVIVNVALLGINPDEVRAEVVTEAD